MSGRDPKSLIPLKPYTLKELGELYGVDWRTFKRWIKPFTDEIGPRQGRFYTVSQVKIMFGRLGLPSMLEAD